MADSHDPHQPVESSKKYAWPSSGGAAPEAKFAGTSSFVDAGCGRQQLDGQSAMDLCQPERAGLPGEIKVPSIKPFLAPGFAPSPAASAAAQAAAAAAPGAAGQQRCSSIIFLDCMLYGKDVQVLGGLDVEFQPRDLATGAQLQVCQFSKGQHDVRWGGEAALFPCCLPGSVTEWSSPEYAQSSTASNPQYMAKVFYQNVTLGSLLNQAAEGAYRRELQGLIFGAGKANFVQLICLSTNPASMSLPMCILHRYECSLGQACTTQRLTIRQLQLVFKGVITALELLHRGDGRHIFIHGDVKADNVLLDRAVSHLSDFGGMCRINLKPGYDYTSYKHERLSGKSCLIRGRVQSYTPRNAAWEVLRGEEASPFCDIWSAGCTLFEACVGSRQALREIASFELQPDGNRSGRSEWVKALRGFAAGTAYQHVFGAEEAAADISMVLEFAQCCFGFTKGGQWTASQLLQTRWMQQQ